MWQVCWWRWLEPPLSSSSDSYGQFPSSPSPIVILCAMCLILLHEVPTMLLPYSPLLVVVFFPLVVVFVAPPSPPPLLLSSSPSWSLSFPLWSSTTHFVAFRCLLVAVVVFRLAMSSLRCRCRYRMLVLPSSPLLLPTPVIRPLPFGSGR